MYRNHHFELACSLGRLSLDGGREFLGHDPEKIMHVVNRPTRDFLAACKQRIQKFHPRLRTLRVLEFTGGHIVSITRA
jgi:hypothetical protein